MSDLITRVRNLLLQPRQEWPRIAAEPDTLGELYTRYVLVLAAVPAVAGFIKLNLIGTGIPLTDLNLRIGRLAAVSAMTVQYLLSVLSAWLLAQFVDWVADAFGAHKDPLQAHKLVAYAYTATWIAGGAVVLPWIGWLLSLLGSVYSIVLLYRGLPVTMRCPAARAGNYTTVVVIAASVLSVLIGLGGGALSGMAGIDAMTHGGAVEIRNASGSLHIDGEQALAKLERMAQQVEHAGKALEQATESGDPDAQRAALGQLMGAALGTAPQPVAALEPEQLRPFVPAQLAGLAREHYALERNTLMGLQLARGQAEYGNSAGGPTLHLEITDLGSAQGLAMLASWVSVSRKRESDLGYERVYSRDGQRIHEQWDNSSRHARYEVVVADRVLVRLIGHDLDMDAVKGAAIELRLPRLAQLIAPAAPPHPDSAAQADR